MNPIEINDVYEAYRKLKNFFYNDNNSLSIRFKIAEYEERFNRDCAFSFEDQFKQAMDGVLKIVNGKDQEGHLLQSLLDMVGFTYITKTVETIGHVEQGKENDRLIINRPIDTSIYVSKMNMLIDAPIEIHIISMLWLMFVGKHFRRILEKNGYAYKFDFDEEDDDIHHGLQMFQPYFIGYQKWRDNALNTALWLLDQGRDASILCLDIQRYYYSVRLDIMNLLCRLNKEHELKIDLENEVLKRLCQLIQRINLQYTIVTRPFIDAKLRMSDEDIKHGKTILPVGLLSSAILANLYLCDFDERIVNELSPAYYGRYVDDMLFVFADHKIEKEHVISNFMTCFESKRILKKENIDGGKSEYSFCQYDALTVQEEKVLLQHFYNNESRAAINQFRKNIDLQRSEFRFLPDEEDVNEEFDSDAFSLQYSDSIQKIRSLQGYKEDKFGAAKFLASKILMASSVKKPGTRESRKRASQQILNFFRWRNCIDFCTLWERVATYFFITEDSDSLKLFIKQAMESINSIEGKDISEEWVARYKKDLEDFLILAVAMPYALNLNFKVRGFEAETAKVCKEKAIRLRNANMFRHNLLGTPGINYTMTLLDNNENLYDRSTSIGDQEHQLLPYLAPNFFRYDEANLLSVLMWLENGKKSGEKNMQEKILDDTKDLFKRINYSWFRLFGGMEIKQDTYPSFHKAGERSCYIELDDNNWEGFVNKRVAIANMSVPDKQVEKSMLKKADLSPERRDTLFSIINRAVKEKCDILILPELSVPYQWLNLLVKQSKKHQMAIIAGIEYYHDKDSYAYNCVATILPFAMKFGNTAAINIRIKNHYSPNEEKLLKGYRCKIPKSDIYSLFHWRKVYFSVYNCFELTNIIDRSLFKSKADFIVATELNKDVNYYADIAGSWVRDIHCYFIQVNTSNYGDSCIMQPSKTETNRMVTVKGGQNSTILVDELKIDKLRSFQLKEHITQMDDQSYKLTPPDYSRENVDVRINNKKVIEFKE